MHVPEMLCNCSLKAAAFHTSTLYPIPQGLKPSQLWASTFQAAKPGAASLPENQHEEVLQITTLHRM